MESCGWKEKSKQKRSNKIKIKRKNNGFYFSKHSFWLKAISHPHKIQVHFTFPTRTNEKKKWVATPFVLAASRKRCTASPVSTESFASRIFKESLSKSEHFSLQAYPPSYNSSPFISFNFQNAAFTAKWQLYGVISNTEIPVKSYKRKSGLGESRAISVSMHTVRWCKHKNKTMRFKMQSIQLY